MASHHDATVSNFLSRSPAGFGVEGHVERLKIDGFTVIPDYMTPAQLRAFRAGLALISGRIAAAIASRAGRPSVSTPSSAAVRCSKISWRMPA